MLQAPFCAASPLWDPAYRDPGDLRFFGQIPLWQPRTIASADISGFFAPILQFEKLEIHKVCLRFPNFILEQNLSLLSLAELCGAALSLF